MAERISQRIQRFLDEAPSPDELAELEELLQSDPRAAETFADAVRMHSALSAMFRRDAAARDMTALFRDLEATVGQSARGENRSRNREISDPPTQTARILTNSATPASATSESARRLSLGWIAAAIVLLMVVGGVVYWRVNNLPRLQVTAIRHLVTEGEIYANGHPMAELRNGDSLRVAEGRPAAIQLADGSRVELRPASLAVLRGGEGEVRQVVELVEGAGKFRVTKGDGQFKVKTSIGQVTVLGTEFTVSLLPPELGENDMKRTIGMAVVVLSGVVQVDIADRSYTLAAGDSQVFTEGGEKGEAKSEGKQPVKAAETNTGFTFDMKMAELDEIKGQRAIYGDTVSCFGTSTWTGFKRLPYKVGPGKVRAYSQQWGTDGGDFRMTVTLGGVECERTLSKMYSRYHGFEFEFDLKQATDELNVKAEKLSGAGRADWFTLSLTNDPNHVYVKKYERPGERGGTKWQVEYTDPVPPNGDGNLVPNSGFEVGIANWDMGSYMHGRMTKPCMLDATTAAHGRSSIEVTNAGQLISRWFQLEGNREYSLSLYLNEKNTHTPQLQVEYRAPDRSARLLVQAVERIGGKLNEGVWHRNPLPPAYKFQELAIASSEVSGWKRANVRFSTLPREETAGGYYRIIVRNGSWYPDMRDSSRISLRADSVQLTEGPELRPYAPRGGLEAGFSSPVASAIFFVNTPSDIAFNVFARPGAEITRCDYDIYDFYDRKIGKTRSVDLASISAERKKVASAPEGKGRLVSLSTPVRFDTSRAGMYRVRYRVAYTADGQARTRQDEFIYNVVHKTEPLPGKMPSLIAADFLRPFRDLDNPDDPLSYLELTDKFGFRVNWTLSTSAVRWNGVVKDRDDFDAGYDFSNADKCVDGFVNNGMQLIHQFHVQDDGSSAGVPDFGVAQEGEESYQFVRKNGRRLSKAKWLDFVKHFVERYRDRISVYAIEDEPGDDFAPDVYVRFYLDTYHVIKKAQPDACVVFNADDGMTTVDELAKITDGKPENFMDGVHTYYYSGYHGDGRSERNLRFRNWLRKNKHLEVYSVSFINPRHALWAKDVVAPPALINERAQDFMTPHNTLDSIFWTNAKCFSQYFAAFPGRPKMHMTIFDRAGNLKPLNHLLSAVNYLLGGYKYAEPLLEEVSIVRGGIADMGNGQAIVGLYATDGKIYEFEIDADAVIEVYDCFGNPVRPKVAQGKLRHYLDNNAIYIRTKGMERGREAVQNIKLSPKVSISQSFSAHESGMLLATLGLKSNEPFRAHMSLSDGFDMSKQRRVEAKGTGEQLSITVPMAGNAAASLDRKTRFNIATDFGDISAKYRIRYAPMQKVKGATADDGVVGEGEWPQQGAGWFNLRGYYQTGQAAESLDRAAVARARYKGASTKGEDDEDDFGPGKTALDRGKACIALTDSHLRGIVRIDRKAPGSGVDIHAKLIPLARGKADIGSSLNISITGDQGKALLGDAPIKGITFAKAAIPNTYGQIIEFSLPLASIPEFSTAKGTVYAVNVAAQTSDATEKDKRDTWYLDAGWHRFGEDEIDRWGKMMVIGEE